MRLTWLVAVLLAGCAAPGPTDDGPEAPLGNPATDGSPAAPLENGTTLRTLAIEGTFAWHMGGSPDDPVGLGEHAIYLGAQAAAGICLTTEGDPYAPNLHLTAAMQAGRKPSGTHAVMVSFDWDDTDYIHDGLYLLFQPGGYEFYTISDRVIRGVETEVPLPVGAKPEGLDLWVCVDDDRSAIPMQPGYEVRPFIGELDVRIEYLST